MCLFTGIDGARQGDGAGSGQDRGANGQERAQAGPTGATLDPLGLTQPHRSTAPLDRLTAVPLYEAMFLNSFAEEDNALNKIRRYGA